VRSRRRRPGESRPLTALIVGATFVTVNDIVSLRPPLASLTVRVPVPVVSSSPASVGVAEFAGVIVTLP
jgi:hypothetical protein